MIANMCIIFILMYTIHMVMFITQDEADNVFLWERKQHEHGDPLPSQT